VIEHCARVPQQGAAAAVTVKLWHLACLDAAVNENAERADAYALIAAILRRPADRALLAAITRSVAPLPATGEFLRAWERMRLAAESTEPASVAQDHAALSGQSANGGPPPSSPPLLPLRARTYLDAQAAASARRARHALGLPPPLQGADDDALHALCEDMQHLLRDHALPADAACAFFMQQLAPWALAAMDDLHERSRAPLHRALAGRAATFFELETARCAGYADAAVGDRASRL
jgi:TorA maturation chaperone TorD